MATISIIVPVYNEVANIDFLYRELSTTRPEDEIIFVDDGSWDGTWTKITNIAKDNKLVRGISFTRNFGKEAAIAAGLKVATGEAVIIMDGDGQHPISFIPTLVKEWETGQMIVQARPNQVIHRSWFKRLTSWAFYCLLNLLSDNKLEPRASDFSLLSRTVVNLLNQLPEKQRFHRGLIPWLGLPTQTISYSVEPRHSGQSVYTTKKLLGLARSAIVSSSTMPMTIIFLLGLVLVFLGIVLTGGLLLYKYFVDFEYIGGASILVSFIILNNGILLLALGVISLYQAAIYQGIQNRPSYIVRELTNF